MEEGVHKGKDLHVYINITDLIWGDCHKDDAISLINQTNNKNGIKGMEQ